MVWNQANPDGTKSIGLGDNVIRENNTAIEAAVDNEHDFSTGGTQSGRHKFNIDTDALSRVLVGAVDGSVALVNDARTGKLVFMARDGGAWDYIDVYQPATLPRLDEQSDFTTCQFATIETIVPTSGSPDTIAIDLNTSPVKSSTVTGDTLIQNPTNLPAGKSTTVTLEVIQDGTGGHTLTFGNQYITVGQVTPAFSIAANERTVFTITRLTSGYLIRSEPSVAGPV